MPTTPVSSPAVQTPEHVANRQEQNGVTTVRQPQTAAHNQRASRANNLPTFPMETNWREVYDPETNTYQRFPLTLQDLLFFTEADIGEVIMAQSFVHDLVLWTIRSILRLHLGSQDWLTTQDVFIHFEGRGVAPKGPDIAVIPDARFPGEGEKSYHVGRDGPPPAFLVEVTSEETRQIDLQAKPLYYASFGVEEFLIIDVETPTRKPWELHGYVLDEGPFYRKLTPDADGGLTFPSMGLRFIPVNRQRVDIFDVATGERLLTPEEQQAQAKAEAARAEAEAAARVAVEAQLAEALSRLRQLENK